MAWTTASFVFLLFAFPNYCERCSYRDVSRKFAEREAARFVPPCCAAKAPKGSPGKKSGGTGGGTHVRYAFCVAKTLSSIAAHRDVLREIRLSVTCTPYRSVEKRFTRLSPVLDHKETRAPPA